MVGGLRWGGVVQEVRMWPTEDLNPGLSCCWWDCWTVLSLLVAGQNQVVICCYSSWKGNGAGGGRWELFSVLFWASENTQALFLCAGCWTGATKSLSKSLKCVPCLPDVFQETPLAKLSFATHPCKSCNRAEFRQRVIPGAGPLRVQATLHHQKNAEVTSTCGLLVAALRFAEPAC